MEAVVRKLPFFLVIAFAPLFQAFSCPKIQGLIDFNCDKKHQIVSIGDSIVYGVGDSDYQGKGGYTVRLKKFFPKSKLYKEGFPGITSSRLYGFYRALFKNSPNHPLVAKLGKSDLLIIDVGRNDYFNRNSSELTVGNLKQLASYLNLKLKKKFGTAPLIVGAELIPSAREFDMNFINAINERLFIERSEAFPFYLRFDLLDPLLISDDGIHPSSDGYAALTLILSEYVSDGAQVRSSEFRIDKDKDSVYDLFEKARFGTDPKKADTDGDGVSDGDEIFKRKTDPLVPDGSVTPSPESTPSPTATATPIP